MQPLTDVWVAYFTWGGKYRFDLINSICKSLRQERTRSFLVFRASSVFDTTSAFSGKGEMSVWRTWHVYDDATEVFVPLAKRPTIGCGTAAVPEP